MKKRRSKKIELGVCDVSLCSSCWCMTYTINGKCGKCKKDKVEIKI